MEAEFGNTMLLCKSTGIVNNPVNELDGNNMGKTHNSHNNRATLGKNEQDKFYLLMLNQTIKSWQALIPTQTVAGRTRKKEGLLLFRTKKPT